MDQLIAFHGIFGSCVLRPPQKDYFFAVPWRGSFGRILTMQLGPPKQVEEAVHHSLLLLQGQLQILPVPILIRSQLRHVSLRCRLVIHVPRNVLL